MIRPRSIAWGGLWVACHQNFCYFFYVFAKICKVGTFLAHVSLIIN